MRGERGGEGTLKSGAIRTGAMSSSATSPASILRDAIVLKGEQIRQLRASGTKDALAAAEATVKELLELKAQYRELTGQEYNRKAVKRSQPSGSESMSQSATDASSMTIPLRPAKQPRLPRRVGERDARPERRT